MSTILTDDEIDAAWEGPTPSGYGKSRYDIARAVIAAYEAKLAQQKPVAWMRPSGKAMLETGGCCTVYASDGMSNHSAPLYTHPAPQQDDRQRVPDEPDWRHPKIQALIGADARNRICIDLVWRILENPRREFTAGDMEYWDKLHDKVQEVALAAAPEASAQALPDGYLREFIGKGTAIVRRFYNLEDQSVVEAGSWMQEAMQLLQLKAAPEAPAKAGNVVAVTKQTAYGEATAYFPEMPEAPAQAVVQDKRFAPGGVFVPNGIVWGIVGSFGHGRKRAVDALHALLAAAPEAPAQASAVDERAAFEAWYSQNAFNFERDPIGSREFGLQWEAWQARAALAQKGGAVAEPTSYSHLAEQVSRLMTIGGATITERQQDVLAAALKALEVGMPTRYPITPERVTPDMRTDDEKLADLRGNPPVADYEHKKPDDTEGGAL